MWSRLLTVLLLTSTTLSGVALIAFWIYAENYIPGYYPQPTEEDKSIFFPQVSKAVCNMNMVGAFLLMVGVVLIGEGLGGLYEAHHGVYRCRPRTFLSWSIIGLACLWALLHIYGRDLHWTEIFFPFT